MWMPNSVNNSDWMNRPIEISSLKSDLSSSATLSLRLTDITVEFNFSSFLSDNVTIWLVIWLHRTSVVSVVSQHSHIKAGNVFNGVCSARRNHSNFLPPNYPLVNTREWMMEITNVFIRCGRAKWSSSWRTDEIAIEIIAIQCFRLQRERIERLNVSFTLRRLSISVGTFWKLLKSSATKSIP